MKMKYKMKLDCQHNKLHSERIFTLLMKRNEAGIFQPFNLMSEFRSGMCRYIQILSV